MIGSRLGVSLIGGEEGGKGVGVSGGIVVGKYIEWFNIDGDLLWGEVEMVK